MKSKKLFTGIAAFLLLSGAAYYYSTINDEFKKSAIEFIDNHLLGKSNDTILIQVPKEVYVIADGTGSRYLNYAIPELDTSFIIKTLDLLYKNDGGKLWMSFIDRDSKNNQVLYIKVESKLETEKPERKNGETSFAYSGRLKNWEKSIDIYNKDSIDHLNKYISDKRAFLNKASKLLKKVYTKGTADNQWTDVIGSLNAALSTISQSTNSNSQKFIVCFSDMEQDAPYLIPKPKLNGIPSDIRVLAVNPIQGSSNMIVDNILEIEHTDRLYEIVFNN